MKKTLDDLLWRVFFGCHDEPWLKRLSFEQNYDAIFSSVSRTTFHYAEMKKKI
jgi:hypothetical protein